MSYACFESRCGERKLLFDHESQLSCKVRLFLRNVIDDSHRIDFQSNRGMEIGEEIEAEGKDDHSKQDRSHKL